MTVTKQKTDQKEELSDREDSLIQEKVTDSYVICTRWHGYLFTVGDTYKMDKHGKITEGAGVWVNYENFPDSFRKLTKLEKVMK